MLRAVIWSYPHAVLHYYYLHSMGLEKKVRRERGHKLFSSMVFESSYVVYNAELALRFYPERIEYIV